VAERPQVKAGDKTRDEAAQKAAVEVQIGSRQGQRTDVELPAEKPEVEAGKETREQAAQKAGFGGRETYRQAKAIVENGAPELIAQGLHGFRALCDRRCRRGRYW
jgi:hypothetical protein